VKTTPRTVQSGVAGACLRWAGEGKSASDIGIILGISARTVEGHIARTCALLGVRTRIQAVVLAKDLGLFARGAA
jgi:DNA-binding CsgD family transcriptional regulator